MIVRHRTRVGVLALAAAVIGSTGVVAASAATSGPSTALIAPALPAIQPVPGHAALVPDVPRTNTPLISTGEIWDLEVVGNRVFVAGSFSSLSNKTGNTSAVSQRYLAAYNIDTGQIDTTFRPTFNGTVNAVEASPDGTKLFVVGGFSTVNGVTRNKVASLNLTTGAPVSSFAFTGRTNNQATALAVSNTTVYVGGKFTRINDAFFTGLAAMNATTGAVDMSFDNQLSGGIGVDGALTVQQLRLTHDETKLLVVHTARQIDGQDRLGIGLIDTQTKQLLPWRTRLWDDYLPVVGGVQRIYAGDVSPDDTYFVVGSGSGGDRPPISDTAVAFPLTGGDNVEPIWVSRLFDSVYSIAITEKAVYLGGHFNWTESPTAKQPWPGLDTVGYGWGQGLSGYGLGDDVVRREHITAIDPATGTALEWSPESNSFEGNKAMTASSRGLFVGGDGMYQGGIRTGRVAFYDFNSVPAPSATDTAITSPIEGRVVAAATPFTIQGTARSSATISRVQVEVQDRDSKQYLQDDLVTWGGSNSINATLGTAANGIRPWSLTVSIAGNRRIQLKAKAFASNGTNDPTKALKDIESFGLTDQTPTTSITGPTTIQTSTSFTVTGTANDDVGVNAISLWFRDENNRYLQDDGTTAPIFNTFRITPDVVGAPSATWSYDLVLPYEGTWRGAATAIDTAGQSDLRSGTRDWVVSANALAPTVTINQPVSMTPPLTVPTVIVTPGSQMTFSGTATDDQGLQNVEITLRNTATRENLANDGTWGVNVNAGVHRISPLDIAGTTYAWSYTTPFNLTPGQYTFTVRATDDIGLTTSTSNRGTLTVLAQVPGDAFPDGLLSNPGTGAPSLTSPLLNLSGTATDDKGVAQVKVSLYDNDTNRYLQANGTLSSGFTTLPATLSAPGATSTGWTLPVTLPTGDFSVTAYAVDTAGQTDLSTTGATGRYRYLPGDAAPTFDAGLGQPVTGAAFTEGKIVISGRALDDKSIARVEVAVIDNLGRYMASNGTFTSTTASWRTAFLNSPGSPGSNFSYTTPVIPDGTYQVWVRATDAVDQVSDTRISTGVTVTHPANAAPVAIIAPPSCNQNVCIFDGRGSTDEDTSTLTYTWTFGTTQGTATGALPTKTFTAPGIIPVTLTVRDQWLATSTTTINVTITEPAGNVAPSPVMLLSNCVQLVCATSSTGTLDPNAGDVVTYSWNWGDGTVANTGYSASHTYATPGSYTVTLTATDGWGKSATATKTLNLTIPPGNAFPTVQFTPTCTGLVCSFNSNGTADPDGDQIRYAWNLGDGTTSTVASPSRTYAAAGTYTVSLTVTDGWNQATTVSQQVIVAP